MAENTSSAMESLRPADVVTHPDPNVEVAREKCLLEEGRELQGGWSFIERLYGLPFWSIGGVNGRQVGTSHSSIAMSLISSSEASGMQAMLAFLSFPIDLFGVAVVFIALMAGMLAAAPE